MNDFRNFSVLMENDTNVFARRSLSVMAESRLSGTVTSGIARRAVSGAAARPGPSSLYQM